MSNGSEVNSESINNGKNRQGEYYKHHVFRGVVGGGQLFPNRNSLHPPQPKLPMPLEQHRTLAPNKLSHPLTRPLL